MIGIDVSDRSIKVAQLLHGRPIKLQSHCTRTLPEGLIEAGVVKDLAGLEKIILSTLQECQIETDVKDTVVASIPERQSFLRVIELPDMREDEIDEAIQWEVARHIPFGLENVYIDWQPLRSGHKTASGRQELLVGAAQKKVVDPLYKVFSNLGLDIAALELESQALVRALISDDLRGRQGILVVDLGGASTNVVIHDHGTVRFTASLQRGSDQMRQMLTADEVDKVDNKPKEMSEKAKEVIEGKLNAVYQELVMEVNSVVEFYNGIDMQHEVREIIMTGGGSNLPGLDKAFLRVFQDVHIERGNPWVNIVSEQKNRQTPISLYESVRYSTALGLALRRVAK